MHLDAAHSPLRSAPACRHTKKNKTETILFVFALGSLCVGQNTSPLSPEVRRGTRVRYFLVSVKEK